MTETKQAVNKEYISWLPASLCIREREHIYINDVLSLTYKGQYFGFIFD